MQCACTEQNCREETNTAMLHIDNLFIAHQHPQIVTKFTNNLDVNYRSKDPFTVARGKIHEYLGMTLDFYIMEKAHEITQCDFMKKFYLNFLESLK